MVDRRKARRANRSEKQKDRIGDEDEKEKRER